MVFRPRRRASYVKLPALRPRLPRCTATPGTSRASRVAESRKQLSAAPKNRARERFRIPILSLWTGAESWERMDQESTFLTTAEVARLLGKTPAAVRAAANAGRLPLAMRTPSGQRLFSREAVERLLRDGREDRTP